MPIYPAPSLHELAVGLYTPISKDEDSNIHTGFGTTTLILEGLEECGMGAETDSSISRSSIYARLLKVF